MYSVVSKYKLEFPIQLLVIGRKLIVSVDIYTKQNIKSASYGASR